MRSSRHKIGPIIAKKIGPVIGLLMLWISLTVGEFPRAHSAEKTTRFLGPSALAVSKDAKTLFVACADARQIAWVDLATAKVTRRISVAGEPTGLEVTPDGATLVVSCAAPKSTLAVFDASSGVLLKTIPAGHTATSPVSSPDGRRVYVCNRFDNDVSVIDLAAGREVARVPVVRQPIAAAITPDGQTLLVANHLPNTRTDRAFSGDVMPIVSLIDTQTLEVSAVELLHGANGLRDICVSPDGKQAFVTHLLSNFEMSPFRVDTGWINVNVLSIIDLEKRTRRSTIGLDYYDEGSGNPYGVTWTGDGKSVCVSLAGPHELAVIDGADLLGEFAHRTMQPMMAVWPIYISLGESLWRRVKLPGKGPRGLASAGSKVYVAQYFSDSVAVVDLDTLNSEHVHDPKKAGDMRAPYVPVAMQENDRPSISTIPLGPPPKLTQRRRGELLFNDAMICYQHWQSCASCHPEGRTDSLNWDLMNDGQGNPKNTKSVLLAHRTPPAMAEGVRESAQSAVRSGLSHILFADRPEEEAAAIDAYLESLRPVPSPHLVDGHLSAAAQRGQKLFKSRRIGCQNCHPAPLYTDLKSHDVGTRTRHGRVDRFDTPTLVEVWRTAPYLHDGRHTTIEEMLVEGRHGLKRDPGKTLTDRELDDLVEFVLSL